MSCFMKNPAISQAVSCTNMDTIEQEPGTGIQFLTPLFIDKKTRFLLLHVEE